VSGFQIVGIIGVTWLITLGRGGGGFGEKSSRGIGKGGGGES